ncbi:Carbamoyl-phosphate synthase large chain [Streptomyces griseoloalbus]
MVNCNPETVSTDYDTSDRLYFEPLTLEDVLEIVHAERQAGPVAGVVVQLGGQTPLGLAQALKDNGVPIAGTPPEAIHAAEDRARSAGAGRGRPAPPKHGTATTFAGAKAIADEIGYPVLVRPSYVLGGRGMEIVYDETRLEAASPSRPRSAPPGRSSSTASSTTPSRSTSTPSTTAPSSTSAASWSTSRRPASTPATRRAPCPRSPSAATTSSGCAPPPRPSRAASACAD